MENSLKRIMHDISRLKNLKTLKIDVFSLQKLLLISLDWWKKFQAYRFVIFPFIRRFAVFRKLQYWSQLSFKRYKYWEFQRIFQKNKKISWVHHESQSSYVNHHSFRFILKISRFKYDQYLVRYLLGRTLNLKKALYYEKP